MDEFEAFWKLYPRKVKKKETREVWNRIQPDAAVLMADVQARIDYHRPWLDGYIPHPTTYLRGERWDDEIEGEMPEKRELTYAEKLARDLSQMEAIHVTDK